jgi:putative transcription factor
MASCEMCGKEVPRTRTVTVGGTVLDVCNECAKFGDEVKREAPPPPETIPYGAGPAEMQSRIAQASARGKPKDVLTEGPTELVEDYPRRIREARVRLKLEPKDLGRRINEKVSVISRLESGEMRPDDKLVKKLEGALSIKLKERGEFQVDTAKKHARTGGVTLGDLIRMEK